MSDNLKSALIWTSFWMAIAVTAFASEQARADIAVAKIYAKACPQGGDK